MVIDMTKAKVGDSVEIKTDSKDFKGILMPDSPNNTLVIKLENGYNVGIDKKRVEKIKLIKKGLFETKKLKKIGEKKDLQTISILHTGGTIASKVDYATGGVISRFSPEELIDMFPELKDLANIESRLVGNMFSEDIRFAHYNVLAKAIEAEVRNGVDGIIITHGTDTMHYSSAALSFALGNLGVPVILVGAQRSSDRGSSDARLNLVCATQFIINSNFAGVGICMHESSDDNKCVILPGLKTKKMHSSRRDAFKSINVSPWASVDENGKIEIFDNSFSKRDAGKLDLKLFKENLKIGILKTHPNMIPEEIANYINFDGLVIEGTGLGHVPVNDIDSFTSKHKRIFNEIKRLSKRTPIVMCSQTGFGRVNMNVYSTGRKIKEFVISGEDMTSETAFIKLAWLLSQNEKYIAERMVENLRGEISIRSPEEFI